ncbi:hypothetical protein LINGRAHAP2_LOCUS6461 [Linum grandiflorum]
MVRLITPVRLLGGCSSQSFWRLFTHIHGQLWEVLYYESRAARHC